MPPILKQSWLLSISLIVLAMGLWFSPPNTLAPIDDISDEYFDDAITSASLAYATTRAVNATVSVVQHSEVQMEPGGLGLSIAAGQILDPVNDMAERLSDVLVTAIVSIGIQKIAFEIGQQFALKVVACSLVALALSLFVPWSKAPILWIRNTILVIVIARLLMPACAAISMGFDRHFVQPEIAQARQTLVLFDNSVEDLHAQQASGLFGKAKAVAAYSRQFTEQLKQMLQYVDDAVTALLTITWWYVAAFLLQAIILPLVSGFCLMRLWRFLR